VPARQCSRGELDGNKVASSSRPTPVSGSTSLTVAGDPIEDPGSRGTVRDRGASA